MLQSYQFQANEDYINQMINTTNEGGSWIWPDAGEVYTIKQGKIFGKKHAIKKIMRITRKPFHSKLVVK